MRLLVSKALPGRLAFLDNQLRLDLMGRREPLKSLSKEATQSVFKCFVHQGE